MINIGEIDKIKKTKDKGQKDKTSERQNNKNTKVKKDQRLKTKTNQFSL